MRIAIINSSAEVYNLAVHKIANYHRARGDHVAISSGNAIMLPDILGAEKIYFSVIFTWDLPDLVRNINLFKDRGIEVAVGGPAAVTLSDWLYEQCGEKPQKPYLDPRFEHQPGDYQAIFTCYDDITEILTENGWKKFKDVNLTNKVATLNKANDCLEYQYPTKLIAEIYSGPMIQFGGYYKMASCDLLVTPKHEMYARKPRVIGGKGKRYSGREYSLIGADKILANPKGWQFKNDAKWVGQEREFFVLPAVERDIVGSIENLPDNTKNHSFKMDDWLEFLGYYLADGSATKKKTHNYKIRLAKTGRKLEMMKACVMRLGFNIFNLPDGFEFNSKALYEYLKPLGHAPDKYVPREFLALSPRQLSILWKGLMMDGSEYGLYVSTSKRLADDMQEILLKTGYTGRIRIHQKKGTWAQLKDGRTITSQHDSYDVFRSRTSKCGIADHPPKVLHYEGMVYCCEVPNHVIYVRRNGIPMWSGNSRGCPRGCHFCVVQQIEGRKMIEYESFPEPVGENPWIMDNNLLACSWEHQQRVVSRLKHVRKLDINSGFDCRIFARDPKKYFDLYSQMKLERWRFAYDKEEERKPLKTCVDFLHSQGVGYQLISVFCLIGDVEQGDTFDKAKERLQYLIDIGTSPYPMRMRPLDSLEKAYSPPGWNERDIEALFVYYGVPWHWRKYKWEEYRKNYNVQYQEERLFE